MFGRHNFSFGRSGCGPKIRGEFMRMRRGDIKFHLLEILKETPRHGYEIISELEKQSGGYRPSPGSVYPTLQMLEEGGYHIKGKTDAEREALLADARALAEAGAFAIVLELVTPPVAKVITASVPVPTIGIGSGPDCDGQILVTPDLVGTFPWFTPRFVKPRLNAAEQMREAIAAWQASL